MTGAGAKRMDAHADADSSKQRIKHEAQHLTNSPMQRGRASLADTARCVGCVRQSELADSRCSQRRRGGFWRAGLHGRRAPGEHGGCPCYAIDDGSVVIQAGVEGARSPNRLLVPLHVVVRDRTCASASAQQLAQLTLLEFVCKSQSVPKSSDELGANACYMQPFCCCKTLKQARHGSATHSDAGR